MGRSWDEVKKDKHALDRARGRDVEADQEHARAVTHAYIIGYRLAQFREERGLSQTQLAALMGVSQPRISKLEKGDLAQFEVGTIERYVQALGGSLRLVVNFGEQDITLDQPAVCA
jgi:predicted XRE-type DNA-binding protein